MLKLIWRQFYKNKQRLIPVILLWILCGYFIFQYQHFWFASLSRWWLDLPVAGEQKPHKAFSYYLQAVQTIEDNRIDLKLMNQSCEDFLPLKYQQDIKDFRPHWLSKLKNWENRKLTETGSLDSRSVEPDTYWKQNQGHVLQSLKALLDAMNYAWEIEPEVHEIKNTKMILIPALFSKYARAVCQPGLSRLVWGDYARFQEQRAWLILEKKDGKLTQFDFNSLHQRKIILEQLNQVPLYKQALQEYVAGAPPEEGKTGGCRSRIFNLSCAAPLDAIEVYQKLIIVSAPNDSAYYHLNLAKTAWYAASLSSKDPELLKLTDEHLNYSLKYRQTERESLFALARLELQNNNLNQSYEYLKRLSIQSRQKNFPIQEFNELARTILIQLDRFSEADCYAPMSQLKYGRRSHCLDHHL